jgi:hypothetical protein
MISFISNGNIFRNKEEKSYSLDQTFMTSLAEYSHL